MKRLIADDLVEYRTGFRSPAKGLRPGYVREVEPHRVQVEDAVTGKTFWIHLAGAGRKGRVVRVHGPRIEEVRAQIREARQLRACQPRRPAPLRWSVVQVLGALRAVPKSPPPYRSAEHRADVAARPCANPCCRTPWAPVEAHHACTVCHAAVTATYALPGLSRGETERLLDRLQVELVTDRLRKREAAWAAEAARLVDVPILRRVAVVLLALLLCGPAWAERHNPAPLPPHCAENPTLRLCHALERGAEWSTHWAVFAGLAALGLGILIAERQRRPRRRLSLHLPPPPTLALLAGGLSAVPTPVAETPRGEAEHLQPVFPCERTRVGCGPRRERRRRLPIAATPRACVPVAVQAEVSVLLRFSPLRDLEGEELLAALAVPALPPGPAPLPVPVPEPVDSGRLGEPVTELPRVLAELSLPHTAPIPIERQEELRAACREDRFSVPA